MADSENISEIAALRPDLMGFIFFEKSKRCARALNPSVTQALPVCIEKVAVFVNASADEILKTAQKYGIKTLQLHGDETPEFCKTLRQNGYKIIKAFGVRTAEDLKPVKAYAGSIDLALLDTKCEARGGSGAKFDWNVLKNADIVMPFYLSGGIALEDACAIKALAVKNLVGADINSLFENAPSILKDTQKISKFIKILRSQNEQD